MPNNAVNSVDDKFINVDVDVRYQQELLAGDDEKLVTDIFGIFSDNIFFAMKAQEKIPKHYDFVTFTGISGSGKTVIKEELKRDLSKNDDLCIIDFDDYEDFKTKFGEQTITDLFKIKDSEDPIFKILSGFGLFEIRIMMSKIKLLSNGQIKRLKYIYLIQQKNDNKYNIALIDEFASELDTLSTISFTRALVDYAKLNKVKLMVFGVNDALIGQVHSLKKGINEVSFIMGNSCVLTTVDNGQVLYKSHILK